MSSRRVTIVLSGILAFGAVAQGLVACTSDDSNPPTTTPKDASVDRVTADTFIPPSECAGEIPVMRAADPTTSADVDPDWSCYLDGDAGFLALEDGGDGGEEADAETPDA